MDLPTSYGTRLLSPFDWTWYAFDWMPIIDVYLWIVLVAMLVVGAAPARRRRAAIVALAFLGLDYSARAVLHEHALREGSRSDASGTLAPCAFAPTLVAHAGSDVSPNDGSVACDEAAALPTFLSPFTWRIVRQSGGEYELSDRVLLPSAHVTRVIRVPTETGTAVERARITREGRVYFDFARFPIIETLSRTETRSTVRLSDARFVALLPSGGHPPAASGRLSIVVTLPGR
jgi:hypothetical protein